MLFAQLLIGALAIGFAPTCQEVTFQSLLKEMTNREAFTRFDDSFTVKQESSYDRRSVSIGAPGWYENADWGGLVRIEENDGRQEKVLFDQKGPGAVTRFWTTTGDKRGIMRFYFDGEEQASVVIDGFDVTKFPLELNRGLAVKHPLYNEDPAATGGTTLFLPIPYGKSLKITFEEPDPARFVHRYYHINYRTCESGTSVRSFSLEEARLSQLLIEQTQKELLEPSEYAKGEVSSKCGLLKPGESLELTLDRGSAAIRNLKIHSDLPAQIVVQAEFDSELCIDTPMADLGGSGYMCRRMDAWWAGCDGNGTVVSRYVMPYRKTAVVRMMNTGTEPARVCVDITTSKYKWSSASMHFMPSIHKDPV